jgi:cupin fold WbuC family metalloprotein|tara:strand:+ start:1052 stop:1459 length:408 start_codon:yes stop_codon:yes gene_type:complete
VNIYSKIKKKKLLHVFFKFNKNINRVNLSPEKEYLQASVVKFKDKKIVRSHHHLNHPKILRKRPIQESWILIKGKAKLTFFDINKKILKNFVMSPGDISISFGGGHKLEILNKNTIIYEYKTGPYKGSKKDLSYF